MRKFLTIFFGILTLLSVVIWIVGALTAAIFPWFGGIRAERVGEIGGAVFISGDGFIYVFGWLSRHFSRSYKLPSMGEPGPKKYGNRKSVA